MGTKSSWSSGMSTVEREQNVVGSPSSQQGSLYRPSWRLARRNVGGCQLLFSEAGHGCDEPSGHPLHVPHTTTCWTCMLENSCWNHFFLASHQPACKFIALDSNGCAIAIASRAQTSGLYSIPFCNRKMASRWPSIKKQRRYLVLGVSKLPAWSCNCPHGGDKVLMWLLTD